MATRISRLKRSRVLLVFIGAFVLSGLVGLNTVVSRWPGLGAQGADILRSVIGNQAVAKLEMLLFQTQDTLQRCEWALGLQKPKAPWAVATTQPKPNPTPQPEITQNPVSTTTPPQPYSTQSSAAIPATTSQLIPSTAQQLITPTPASWVPHPASALGSLDGEGAWAEYIQNSNQRTVCYRTFIQPDASRPYTIVAVIAFDLSQTRLHYVLGSVEPFSPDSPKRSGTITPADLQPGILLATFNGGFKATHGQFGAMADGLIALPPRDGLGTVAIYTDGKVRMGEWGSDITASENMQAWRQNGPLVIHDGKINPRIYNNSPKDWGYTVDDVSPTWRSGIGISPDGSTLYYFVGPKMTMEALAKTMLAVGAAQGLQLDINNYWVHFVAIQTEGEKLVPVPLFPDSMSENVDRYLHAYTRDFFYVTSIH